ncbi:hypothetical protein DFJ73DRAFT_449722 [Zopfochytrium polystomum]|nr:hypothetical protein DFJ73DRAFT_449722 [Zopfochytrium polystomum]
MSAHHPELPTESGSDGYEITQLDDDPLDYGDIEAGIAAHLNVGDTLDAMIAAAVTERNTLRAQNEQMWKIIEKQRTIIQQVNEERAKDKEEVARLKSLLEAGSRSAEPADTPTPSPAPTPTPKPPKKQGVSFRMFTEEVVPNSKAEPSSSAARSSSPPPAAPISSILGLEPVKFDETDAKAKSSVIEDSEASTSKKVNVNRLSKARLSMRISEEDAKLYNMYFSAILDSDSSTLDLASSLFTPPPAKPADSDEPADPADEEPSEDESEEEVEDADTLTSAEPQNSFKFLAPVQVSTSVSSGRPVPDSPRTAPQPPQRMESRSNSESFAQPSVRSAERQSSVSIGAPYGSVRSEYDSGASQRANGLPFISTRSTSEPSLVISTSNGSPGSYPGGTGHLAPPLPPRELPSLEGCTFTVVSSRPLGDRTLAFVIHVQGHESWTIERGSSDFASLDMKIRSVSRNPHTKNMPALDRSIFTAYSTFKFDQRKNLIEQYLRRLHDYEKDAKDLVEFFTNGLSPSPARRESRTRHSQVGESQVLKEGYLHKKNKGLNSWKSRYFKCRVGVLELYDDCSKPARTWSHQSSSVIAS